MKTYLRLCGILFLLLPVCVRATTHYVDLNSINPSSPYTDWSTAATNIQDAITASVDGDTVLVTNGVYATGGISMDGTLTNRVSINKAITVQSVNGPWVTIIDGGSITNSSSAIRGAWLTNGAALIGFTIQRSATRIVTSTLTGSGGGIWCYSSNCVVANCVIKGNMSYYLATAVYQGNIQNCLISSNISGTVNAVSDAILNDCTIIGNSGYGVAQNLGRLLATNCIIYLNQSGNYLSGTYNHCCTIPLPSGTGNFTNSPQLFGDGVHLSSTSPCIGVGITPVRSTDLFGRGWSNAPAVGCAEYDPAPTITVPQIRLTDQPLGFAVRCAVQGQAPLFVWWLKDGVPLQDDTHFVGSQTTNLTAVSTLVSDAGSYQLVASNAVAVVTSTVTHLAVHCVDASGTNATAPYATWDTAATNIQDAITVALDTDVLLVTNGVYSSGGKTMDGVITNRVSVDKAIAVQSVNGPFVTIIQAGSVTNGTAAVRGAWLTNGAALAGFTVQGGATRLDGGSTTSGSGGGVWCSSSNAVVANCIIFSNMAYYLGGGVYRGSIVNCLITSNRTYASPGGSVCDAILNNCTIVGNATYGLYQYGAALRVTNCIIYANSNSYSGGIYSHCCITPLPGGTGNFTNPPLFFADGVHLSSASPCIGVGVAPITSADLFGKAWSNAPSIGCAEYDPSPMVATPQLQLSGDPMGFICQAAAQGDGITTYWLKDGVLVTNGGEFSFAQTTSLVIAGTTPADAGSYQLVVSNALGVVTSSVVQLSANSFHFVNPAGVNPTAPYSTWDTAATNIQDAIAAAAAGDVVVVTNGLYSTGGKSMDGVITNRVVIDKPILVRSLNGARATRIQGAWDTGSYVNGPAAIRCIWMTNNAVIAGFTISGGGTRLGATPDTAVNGGGIWSVSNNAVVANCVIVTNAADNSGGGAYRAKLISCALNGNFCRGPGTGDGGGAKSSILLNCILTGNAGRGNGGGTESCKATNCAFVNNQALNYGSGAYAGTLANCTLVKNIDGGTGGGGGAAAFATIVNSIVYGNIYLGSGASNYYSCTFTSSDSEPLPAGNGNVDVDPQLLGDKIHLAPNSPCIGAGTNTFVFGVDIDGQAWSNSPSMGCDEWHPEPVIAVQPSFSVEPITKRITFFTVAAGQPVFSYAWLKDGGILQDGGVFSNSGDTNLTINPFGPSESGNFQIVVSNTYGITTSAVATVTVRGVDAAGSNPLPPYSTWATAATNIQDAIDSASWGDIILVTNGVYASGGKVMAGDLTNRVALDKVVTVMSVNGYSATVIQGAWDPLTTNGPGAVRCAYVGNGAVLTGFTLQNGATRSTGDSTTLQSGGGVWCSSTNGIVSNCVLTNNRAVYGGGIAFGALKNSFVAFNAAGYGGGAYNARVQNCTVMNNHGTWSPSGNGSGTYGGSVLNSIVYANFGLFGVLDDNYGTFDRNSYSYCVTYPVGGGVGNRSAYSNSVQLLDSFHISSTSPCVGAGSVLYSSGYDLDGEPFANPPSIGCDEVILSNLTGSLSVQLDAYQTNWIVNHYAGLWGTITGRATRVDWSFGEGVIVTNVGSGVSHVWTNAGDYPVIFTAYNLDNPSGVSANLMMHVLPLTVPQLQEFGWATNGFQFQFAGQSNANYVVQYATNLAAPSWQTLQNIYFSTGQVYSITDTQGTNAQRFYRVVAQ